MNRIHYFLLALLIPILFSCSDDDIVIIDPGLGGFAESGSVIIINEGSFGANNGSVSFISNEGNATQNIFFTVNGISPGDIVQSYSRKDTFGILAVNNSQKVEIVHAESFASLATITSGLDYPRYSLPVCNNKVYVTNGSAAGTVVVIDLSTLSVINSIDVGQGPEALLKVGDKVYIANSGGWGNDSTVSIINTTTDTEISKVVVGDIPKDMVEDEDGNIWVLCKGQSDFSNWPDITKLTPSKLVMINTATSTVAAEIILIDQGEEGDVSRLTISPDRTRMYYLKNGMVFKHDITQPTVETTALITGDFYGLDVNPESGEIWATTNGFSENQELQTYSSAGVLSSTLDVGIGPNGSYFNE